MEVIKEIIMKNAKLNWVRLPLKNIENCRELGGYHTKDGQQTKWHSFLRSSDMSKIDREDIEFLTDYGVNTVIDLRRSDEIEKYKNPLADIDSVEYYNIPFITEGIADITKSEVVLQDISLGDFYVKKLENKQAIKEIFHTIYHAKDGCIVFHCQAGKDRTGILAMLLLGLAGVEKKDIISNYEVTYTNLESLHQGLHDYKNIPKHFLLSAREDILRAYEHIVDKFGNFNDYLRSAGIEQEIIDGVKTRLIQDEPLLNRSHVYA